VSVTPLAGHDGWLFLPDDANDVSGQHTGHRTLGVDCRFYVAPDKEAVYAGYLPADVVPSAERPGRHPPTCLHEDGHPLDRLGANLGYRRICADIIS